MSPLYYAALLLILLQSMTSVTAEKYPKPLIFVKFDGSTVDLTGRNTYPSFVGDLTYTTGPYNDEMGAISLSDGVYLEWVNGVDGPLAFQDEYTISMWVKHDGGGKGALISYTDASGMLKGTKLRGNNGQETLTIRKGFDNGGAEITSSVPDCLQSNVWMYLALTYQKSTGIFRLYKDRLDFWREKETEEFYFGETANLVQLGSEFDGAFSCLQIYSQYMTFNEISKTQSLCRPQAAALNPWPTPIGLWPLNGQFEGRDMKPGVTNNNGEIFGSFLTAGPSGSPSGSYELRGLESSYIEISNADYMVSPVDSLTFSIWLYPTDESMENYPLFSYEYGTEDTAYSDWAFHIWKHPGLYFHSSTYSVAGINQGNITYYQWNFLSFSLDSSSGIARGWVNNDQFECQIGHQPGVHLLTRLANRIRIGKSFFPSDIWLAAAKVSCVQMYDVPMSIGEMKQLASRCDDLKDELSGASPGLVLMFPFNRQSRCHSVVPRSQQHHLTSAECVLSRYGPRQRNGEAITLSRSSLVTDSAVFKPRLEESALQDIKSDSSFTFMLYIKLDLYLDEPVKVGFLNKYGTLGNTWFQLSSNGDFLFSAGSLTMYDTDMLSLVGLYNQEEVEWIHLAISCNCLSARCYIFRNASFVGESVESLEKEWFVSTHISIGNREQPPLPVRFWPLNKIYGGREVTGRSRPIEFTNGILFSDEDPYGFNQGSLWRDGTGESVIPANPGMDVRHSMSLQVYIKMLINQPSPYFTYFSNHGGKGVKNTLGTGAKMYTVLMGINEEQAIHSTSIKKKIPFQKWTRLSTTFDYSTATLRQYVDGIMMTDTRVKHGVELFATIDVIMGSSAGYTKGEFKLTCVQLYNTALSIVQLNKAAQLCHNKDQGHFQRPYAVETGYTQSPDYMNSTSTVRNRLECLQLCADNSQCLALNFNSTERSCSLTSVMYADTGMETFQNTGETYLEKVHPLIAESL